MQNNLKIMLSVVLWLILSNRVSGQLPTTEKKAILLVSFGTSYPEARRALHSIEATVENAFPDAYVQWAYTSSIIRKKLSSEGIVIPSPDIALAQLIDQGYTNIRVQSLHIIPGEEFQYLQSIVKAFEAIPKRQVTRTLGHPLMYTQNDIAETAKNMIKASPSLQKDQVVLWMAHGTRHHSAIYYPALQYILAQQSASHYLATVEHEPSLENVLQQLKAAKVRTIYLQPLMTIAGDHVLNDMAGEDSASWKNQLEMAGFRVECVKKGLIQNEIFVDQWINHIKQSQ